MKLLGLAILAIILIGTTGCYYGYYHRGYPYYSRAAVAPGYVSYETPYRGVTYYDPGYDPYYYHDYYPAYRTYNYPRTWVGYTGWYHRPRRSYSPPSSYHRYLRPSSYSPPSSYRRYPRPSSPSSSGGSFLRKLR